jgi:parvulin-like peptidyl-prolyl isomerase
MNEKIIKKIKKMAPLAIFTRILIVMAGYLFLVAVFLYFYPFSDNALVRKTARYIHYPAVISSYGFVSADRLFNQSSAVKKFYENQDFSNLGLRVDFSTPEGKNRLKIKEKNVLNKLIENSIVESEAKKNGIELSDEIVNQEVDRKMKEYGSAEYLRNNLEKLYGWELDDFKENIVKPDMYKEKLFEKIKTSDKAYAEAGKKIENAEKKLIAGGKFEDVVEEYSEGESAKAGGELGWFSADQMLPEVSAAVFGLKKGDRTKITESSIGYHIIEVEDKKSENNSNLVKVRQIFVKTKSFSDWIAEKEKNINVCVLNRELRWNREKAQLEFRDGQMNKFEEDMIKNSSDDVSVLF